MKNKYKLFLIIITGVVLIFSGCHPTNYSQVSQEDIQGLNDYVFSSYYMIAGDTNTSAGLTGSRATVPVHNTELNITTFTDGSLSGYPEPGQTTAWTVTETSTGSGIYKIDVITTYPNNPAIEQTREIYYVKDTDSDGAWTTVDEVVDQNGDVNNLYRETFETTFADGGIRYEEIETNTTHAAATGADPVKYTAFAKPTYTADAASIIPAAESDVITTDSTAQYSSKVNYQQEVYKRFAFWNLAYKIVIGTRYYTEHLDGDGNIVQTSITFERTVERSERGRGGLMQLLKDALYDPTVLNISNATLSETVIWYKIVGDGEKKIEMKSKIINDFGDDFYLTASDGAAPVISGVFPTK